MKAYLSPLDELMTRSVASSTDRPAWLRARTGGVTATEVAKLAKGGPGVQAELVTMKLSGELEEDLSHLRYIRWGQIREEYIGEWVERRFNIQPNQVLFRGENPRHLATPDGVGCDFDERLLVCEIKTSLHDLDPALTFGHYRTTLYADQKQWQLHVTGAQRALFAWEQHDDDWSGWPDRGPAPVLPEPEWRWVERDEERIAHLVKVADRFLVALDEAAAGKVAEFDVELDVLGQEVIQHRASEGAAKRAKDASWKALQERLVLLPSFSQSGAARVTWSPSVTEVVTSTVPDDEAAVEADPVLFAAFVDARAAWEAHLAGFTKPVESSRVTPAKLTVTPMKVEKKGVADVF
ncbi:YqaJ viral recombinase family protein [Cryobacterium fucosi]|uniref:YqaJ viral recombinase domain-containing protein n=1 Tax=Cryobacterium fucosi TaxID=1259157 RepID=A0A4R9B3C2_9MICO|nr:YqaJ viral recombinase family protein [Cryobacterium fucosi]TFD74704.1 hypothetical protein E3T48_12320 [Cryobacterium fucosi]